jgi:glycerol-3-phosphate cytidylyltransferase
MLEDAKDKCDYNLPLQTDPTIDTQKKNSPTQSVVERYADSKDVFTWMK